MDKNQKELVVLLLIISCIINYAFYNFYLEGRLKVLKEKKEIYVQSKSNLEYIKNESEHSSDIKERINKLNAQSSAVDVQIPEYIDTPQLVYDFYTACKNYKVQGEKISFQLDRSSKNSGENSASEESGQNTGTIDARDTEKSGATNTAASSAEPAINGLAKLTIQLSLSGSRDDMDNFIRHLNNITKRKLNVNSINLSYSSASSADSISAVIIFNQYVQTDSSGKLNIPSGTSSEYSFYKNPVPYNNITDMLQGVTK